MPWRANSPDLRTSVEVTARGKRACVTVASRSDGCFDGVSVHAIAFSRQGAHIAYPVLIGARWAVVRDGVAGVAWDAVGAPVLSADGTRLAYPAARGSLWHVVADEVAGPPFDAILDRSYFFDPTGRRLGYVARRSDSVHVVVDDRTSRGWNAVARLAFSDNGEHVAYVAGADGRTMLVVDDRPQPSHPTVGDFAFARRGEKWAYAMRDSSGWYVVERSTRYGPFTDVRALAYGPSNDALTFVASQAALETVFIAGTPSAGWHETVDTPVFAVSGNRMGYVAHGADQSEVFLDGELLAREEHASDLAIGVGARYAYVASAGDRQSVVDERGRHELDMVIDGTLQFIADGSRWVCLAGDRARRELFVVLDGTVTNRRLDWSEMVRLVQRPGALDALRTWVAAAGTLALEEAGAVR